LYRDGRGKGQDDTVHVVIAYGRSRGIAPFCLTSIRIRWKSGFTTLGRSRWYLLIGDYVSLDILRRESLLLLPRIEPRFTAQPDRSPVISTHTHTHTHI